ALVAPRADDRAVRQLEVLDAAFDPIANGGAGRVAGFRLDRDDPAVRVERGARDRDVVGARIDDAGDVLAVPVEHEQHVLAVHVVAGPGSEPGALQRVAFLRGGRRMREQRGERERRGRGVQRRSADRPKRRTERAGAAAGARRAAVTHLSLSLQAWNHPDCMYSGEFLRRHRTGRAVSSPSGPPDPPNCRPRTASSRVPRAHAVSPAAATITSTTRYDSPWRFPPASTNEISSARSTASARSSARSGCSR